MEVAAVRGEIFFDENKSKIAVRFEDEFDALVNPEIEVPAIALQLTGIKIEDLRSALPWKEIKAKFDSFIHAEIIVGHNIGFDLGYLENQGVRLKNEFIDTLELSQTLLPVSASHSLEALAENLGVLIGVSHRALEDCKTAALVLAETLNQFLQLPAALQSQIKTLFIDSGSVALGCLRELPEIVIKGPSAQTVSPPSFPVWKADFAFGDKKIYSTPISFSRQRGWLAHLASLRKSAVIGVPSRHYLDSVPQDQQIASPARALCPVKFRQFMANPRLSHEARRMVAKILIFSRYFGSLDLGKITFNPGERALLSRVRVEREACPGHNCEYYQSLFPKHEKNLFAELDTLFSLVSEWKIEFKNRKALLFDLAEIEEGLLDANSTHLTLRKARDIIGVVYPVDESGFSFCDKLSKESESFLNELDLFFGILHLVYLKRPGEYSETLVLDERERENSRFEKMTAPAEKLIKKTEEFMSYLENKKSLVGGETGLQMAALQKKLNKLKEFFSELFLNPDPARWYWLRFDSEAVALNFAPKDLKPIMREFLESVESLSIVDTELAKLSREYFVSRLGIENFEPATLPGPADGDKVKVKFLDGEFSPETLGLGLAAKSRPSIVIVSNESQLLKFFEFFTREETLRDRLVSYKYSGGLGNVRRKLKNLSDMAKPFIFLLTTNAASKYFKEFPAALDLYIQKIPFEAPSAASPARKKDGARSDFLENALPRALYLLNSFISRFVFEQKEGLGQEIFFADRRIVSDYDQAFLNYLRELSGVQVEL